MDDSELLTSPAKADAQSKTPKQPSEGRDADEVRDAALKRELEGVRNINEVLEGVIGTLERANGNMRSVSQTVTNASTLLNTWTRILSQTEHNQRLLLNPNWKGATQEQQDVEAEATHKRAEAERRAAEAERDRSEAARRQAEEERQRSASAAGRGRGLARGRGTLTRGAPSSKYGIGSTRNPSTISKGTTRSSSSTLGRGLGGTRTTRGTSRAGRGVT